MRSGGSVLEAPPGAEEGALPRGHRPRADCTELHNVHRPQSQPDILSPVELNFDGATDMRSGGSVLEVPQAPMRGHSPASIVRGRRDKSPMNVEKALQYLGEPFLYPVL